MRHTDEEWALALAWVAGLLETAPCPGEDRKEQVEMALMGARKLLRAMPGFPANDETAA